MRAGAYTIHQSLTAEAAAVLKLALGLARRRGHAQVTPLHVAFALLTSGGGGPTAQPTGLGGAFASSSSYGLLKRACLRSHPGGAAAAAAHHPLQCRALELCFNVALNRLPTSMSQSQSHSPPPPMMGGSSFASSLMIQPSPTLSNALVAALKRAQANQRRGCVELHHTPPSATSSSTQQQQSQQQPPLLAIKVELDQLVISILDDPSVSRVMREAGFSSSQVKTNLEEESALMPPPHSSSSTSPPPPPSTIPPHFFHDHPSINNGGFGFGPWPAPAQFLAAKSSPCKVVDDDVRAVLDVMVRRQSNPVVVGDSASMAEAVADELLRRLERGGDDVPEALAGAHLLRLQLSYVHARLMTRADVDARAAELRRGLDAAQLRHHHRGAGGGLVVFVGDLRWAIHDDDPAHHDAPAAYSPVDHMVAELGRLVDDLRASRGRAWLVATASYQTYMRWQQRRRRRPTEAAWALQAVLVPTGGGTGLALNNLHHQHQQRATAAAGAQPAMWTMQHQPGQRSPFTTAPNVFGAERDGQQEAEKLVLCAECSKNYEREASLVKAETADAEGPRAGLPAWLVPDRTAPPVDQAQHKDKYLVELKRKWSRLCRKLHLCVDPPCSASPSPRAWWSGPCVPPPSRPTMAGLLGLDGLMMAGHGKSSRTSEWPAWCGGLASLREPDVGTALALGNLQPLSDTASSDGGRAPGCDDGSVRELERRLRRNIPWQPAAVAAEIAEAVIAGEGGNEEKGNADHAVWLYVKGSDHAAVRRAAAVIAEAADRVVICVDAGRFGSAEELCADVASKVGGGWKKLVLMFGDVERAAEDVVECLVATSRSGCLKDRSPGGHELDLGGSVIILTTAKLATGGADDDVISLRLWSEEDGGDRKRRPDAEPSSPTAERKKRPRHDLDTTSLDLNVDLCAATDDDSNTDEEDEEEEAVPSDITHEGSSVDDHLPRSLLGSVAAVVNLDDDGRAIRDHLRARLAGALAAGEHQHHQPKAAARVEDEAVEALTVASGHFLEDTMERWAAEVLQPAVAATVSRNGGKGNVLVLGVGPPRQINGFMGSVLPSRVHVE
ncbi:hypothetical protein QOZ80_4AG0323520 [Eleusine coracana subsp. coracana]|nr:hypothetical protein QOZ80_4AG0323520 [Eleusine coracana subsp. coracana]